MSELIVTTAHLFTIPSFSKRPGFCRGRSRAFCERHGIDWRSFVRDGVEASRLEATNDGMALALVAWARECEARDGR